MIIILGVRLLRPQAENVSSKTTEFNLSNSLNKNFNQLKTYRFYSTILSSNWKSTEGILNKNTFVAPSKIMQVFNNVTFLKIY